MTPRASFVIPAYNADRWLSKAIWSCRNQTIKQIEIIVVNDASTDGTFDIAEWHAGEDKRVRVYHLPENKKSSHARNFGNDAAQSPIIMMLDADDMSTRNRTKDTLAAFELKKPDYLYGSFFLVDSTGTAQRKVVSSLFDPVLAKQKNLNFICHSTTAYTKALSEKVRYDEGIFNQLAMEDWKFQWDVYSAGFTIKNARNPFCYSRVLEGSQSSGRDQAEVNKVKTEYLAHV